MMYAWAGIFAGNLYSYKVGNVNVNVKFSCKNANPFIRHPGVTVLFKYRQPTMQNGFEPFGIISCILGFVSLAAWVQCDRSQIRIPGLSLL